ncbi:hypothetical protein JCM19241_3645 [Vibrio ishigakensis]|uniref:Uncharacterized protein n=1 Tax=Vibrio ishigakensis TaxID=1481914 RepID=A0A0B8QKU6_9VIBR|nr:hypothetical protein JCM19241_3645 [Vibrio ishigakensis]
MIIEEGDIGRELRVVAREQDRNGYVLATRELSGGEARVVV